MNRTVSDESALSTPASGRWLQTACVVAVIVAAVTVYAGSFSGRFVFEDYQRVIGGDRLRDVLSPAAVARRQSPVADITLALNYAAGGRNPRGFHAVNLAIHVLAGLTLFGLVRRTMLQPRLRERFAAASSGIALTAALIWVVHPLTTQAVTYIGQRGESLMGLCFLLTMYCVVRGFRARRPGDWYAAAVAFCALGMGSRPAMAAAPVVVWLYDRSFGAGTIAVSLRRRPGLYAALAATWLVLLLPWALGGGAAAAGDVPARASRAFTAAPLTYFATPFGVMMRYLHLSFWPVPLCLDYDWALAMTFGRVAWPLLPIVALIGAAGWSFRARRSIGFVAAAVLLVLVPISSLYPMDDPLAEHRMYLPLAGVVVACVTGVYALRQQLSARLAARPVAAAMTRGAMLIAAIGVFASLGITTSRRNALYADPPALWQDVLAKRPQNTRAVVQLGLALIESGQFEEALPIISKAVVLRPESAPARNGLGLALIAAGRGDEALDQFREAIRLKPDYVRALANLSAALVKRGRVDEARPYFQRVLEIDPQHEGARLDKAISLLARRQPEEGIEQLQAVVHDYPDSVTGWGYLGTALVNSGRFDEAAAALDRAVGLRGGTAQLWTSLGFAQAQLGRTEDAIETFRQALLLEPKYVNAHVLLGRTFRDIGEDASAARHLAIVAELQPDHAAGHYELGMLLEKLGRHAEAAAALERAVELDPGLTRAAQALERIRQAEQDAGAKP